MLLNSRCNIIIIAITYLGQLIPVENNLLKLLAPKILHGRGKNCIVAGSNTTVPIARASCKQRKKFLCQIRIGK